jgi:hypothetical protein
LRSLRLISWINRRRYFLTHNYLRRPGNLRARESFPRAWRIPQCIHGRFGFQPEAEESRPDKSDSSASADVRTAFPRVGTLARLRIHRMGAVASFTEARHAVLCRPLEQLRWPPRARIGILRRREPACS